MRYQIPICVKPHVKRFIEQNYSLPASFYKDKGTMFQIRLLLNRKSNNNSRPVNTDIYSEEINIYLSEDDYNRYGGILSAREQLSFNNIFENRLRLFMTSWVGAQYFIGRNAGQCVADFQEKYGYPEEVWKFDCIYKYCQRNNVFMTSVKNALFEQISKIILEQMSKNRTLTNKAIDQYEKI